MSAEAGHNNAAGQFRAFVERIERLQEERKSIADDIADVFKELASDGYDKEAAKTVLKIRAAKDGIETWTARSHIVDTYLAALGMLPEEAAHAPAGARVEKITQFPPQKTEATEMDRADEGSFETGIEAAGNARKATATVAGTGSVSHAGAGESPAPIDDFEPPTFLVKQQKPLRPDCLNPTECAGYGTTTCHRCKTAARESEAA